MFVEAQVSCGVSYIMLIILRVVSTIKGKRAFSKRTVQVSNLIPAWCLAQNNHIGFDGALSKIGCLTDETLYGRDMVLRQHGRNGIPLCAEVK